VVRVSSAHCLERDSAVKSHESAIALHREREQINVGELLRSEDTAAVDDLFVEERYVIGPEFVVGCGYNVREEIERIGRVCRFGKTQLRHNPQKSILRQRTRRPTVGSICCPPLMRAIIMSMILLQERDEESDVEQRPHGLNIVFK